MSDASKTLVRPYARLDWSEAGGPRSVEAGDVYFSAQDGLAESRAVFLEGCDLAQAFAASDVFVIGELGFGTGLNFLAAWDLFRRTAPASARLHFVSVEGFPLRQEDVRRALATWPELAGLAAQLVEAWPSPRKGPQRRSFEAGRVTLTVFHDEILAALQAMELRADAWFLDGFSPSKNPQMWSEAVFAELARLSAPDARLATFTVAGAVRRGLEAAGFEVAKLPGFGRKRERLAGRRAAPPPALPVAPLSPGEPVPGRIAVLGGGIAAASLAHALSRRRRDVTLYAEGGLAAGASGAPLGLLTPRLEAADRPHVRATLAAFDYARQLYRAHDLLTGEGTLRLPADEGGAERLQRLADMLGADFEWLGAGEAARRSGLNDIGAGLWMASAAWFDPVRIVRSLAAEVVVREGEIARVERGVAAWRLLDASGTCCGEAEVLILAGGADTVQISHAMPLPVETTAGRLARFRTGGLLPRVPVSWGHYLAPLGQGELLVGATHVRGTQPGEPQAAETVLRAVVEARAASLAEGLEPGGDGWGGVRAALADRLPAVGPMAGPDYAAVWQAVARGGPLPTAAPSGLAAGLYVMTGFGARGFAHAPLLAEALASMICGEPGPLERAGREALHPARFLLRRLRRGGA